MKKKVSLLMSLVILLTLLLGNNAYSTYAATDYPQPPEESDTSVTWDCVYFGQYYQDDTNGDGKANEQDTM